MFVSYAKSGRHITFKLQPTEAETAKTSQISLGAHIANVELPYDVGDIHPDILALCAFLIAGPFAKDELTFQLGISPKFAEAMSMAKPKCKIGPIDDGLAARPRPENGKPGLCFSGGVDSTAALELLPSQTEMFFLKRTAPFHNLGEHYWLTFKKMAAQLLLKRKTYLKSSEAGTRFCEALRMNNREAFVIGSNLEYVRDPVGFPHDRACTVPLLLMADARNLDAVAWGTIAEAAYQFGNFGAYKDLSQRKLFKHYSALFSAVGLPILNPVVGLSEVATSRIVSSSVYLPYTQSCQRESIKPCRRCIKCFRKSLLDATVSGEWPDDKELDRYFSEPDIRKTLEGMPIKLENVYAFIASRYAGRHPAMLALKRRVRGDEVAVDWMTKYIPSSIELAPPKYRSALTDSLSRFVDPMSAADVQAMTNWNVNNAPSDPQTIKLFEDLKAAMRI